jgi:hypothetical protein
MGERFHARITRFALSIFGILVVSTYGSGRDARAARAVAITTHVSFSTGRTAGSPYHRREHQKTNEYLHAFVGGATAHKERR